MLSFSEKQKLATERRTFSNEIGRSFDRFAMEINSRANSRSREREREREKGSNVKTRVRDRSRRKVSTSCSRRNAKVKWKRQASSKISPSCKDLPARLTFSSLKYATTSKANCLENKLILRHGKNIMR